MGRKPGAHETRNGSLELKDYIVNDEEHRSDEARTYRRCFPSDHSIESPYSSPDKSSSPEKFLVGHVETYGDSHGFSTRRNSCGRPYAIMDRKKLDLEDYRPQERPVSAFAADRDRKPEGIWGGKTASYGRSAPIVIASLSAGNSKNGNAEGPSSIMSLMSSRLQNSNSCSSSTSTKLIFNHLASISSSLLE